MDTLTYLQTLADAALGTEENAFISIMAKKSRHVRQDIPAAFDAYAMFSYFLHKIPIKDATLSDEGVPVELAPAIYFDRDNGRVLALIPIGVGELSAVSYWCTNSMMSETIRQMPGLLALPFSLETHAETEMLIPDWCAAFFVDGHAKHCVPILVLQSMLSYEAVGQDWVGAALARLRVFSVPVDTARQFILQTGLGEGGRAHRDTFSQGQADQEQARPDRRPLA
ncbi:MAG: hypothetical protein FWF12_10605 [Betaproteobacteria bacterium]|nr:hypothetical protein [Betaproteobacteria bacterium]